MAKLDAPWQEIACMRLCGCWIVRLAQGRLVLLCTRHETRVLEVIYGEG